MELEIKSIVENVEDGGILNDQNLSDNASIEGN